MAVETEKVVITAPPMSAEPKKSKAKVAKSKPNHPTWATMIEVAVKEMNEKGGSSIPAIKKFILSHNNTVDKVRLTSHMRRAVNTLTNNGTLIQAKGHGLTGSFKLGMLKANKKASAEKKAATEKKTKPVKKESAPKTKEPKNKQSAVMVAKSPAKPKAKATKKTAAPKVKKPAAKKPVAKKAAAAEKPKVEKKVPSKPKVSKTAKKPKSPKPKTIKKVAAKPKAKSTAPK